MARYQLRRPSPVKVFPRYDRRQQPAAGLPPGAGQPEEEAESSPGSSPSTVGGSSEGEDSDSEDEATEEAAEPPSPTAEAAPAPPPAIPTLTSAAALPISAPPAAPAPTSFQTVVLPPSSAEKETSTTSSSIATSSDPPAPSSPAAASSAPTTTTSTTTSAAPAFTAVITSQGNNAALPQITGVESNTTATTSPSATTATLVQATLSLDPFATIPSVSSAISSSTPLPSPSTPPPSITLTFPTPAESETSGENSSPQRSFPRPEPPILTKGAAVAAIVLGVLGALALIIAAVIFIKRRKRRQAANRQRLGDDAFSPGNTGSLRAPETAHLDSGFSFFGRGSRSTNSLAHQTRFTDRSNTLFGAGSYSRPETTSTNRSDSRIPGRPPTANPFADPPLNKAYDVLRGRPRSTTLTDRGSWIKNPFRNPESERFDPFGELQAKAERARYLEEARREAELIREYEQREKEFAAKERMGLAPDGLPRRKGSNVTIEGLGVLDRTSGSFYR